MGLCEPLVPGTHFPRVEEEPWITVEELDERWPWETNHPSFDLPGDDPDARPPAWALLEEQVNNGFALLFTDADAASKYLGGPCHPAPLGNVVKVKDDGSLKHRLIQDLRANGVNDAVRLTERQVLPRGLDHGADLARLGAAALEGESVFTLVLDFKDAFMSVPLHRGEQRFNCANAGFRVQRTRRALIDDEPSEGTFVVWRTLGFGGRPNPLVFSRVASFAARSAQALLGTNVDAAAAQVPAPGFLELYVDDPVISVRAKPAEADATFDMVILWWLTLGLPLSWKKGSMSDGSVPHRWIGIEYTLTEAGAIMRLPPQFVKDLLQLIDPICQTKGTIARGELDVLIGKAARVAFVVPAAKPFVAGLWGGLAAHPRGRIPHRRLCFAASWVKALLSEDESCPLALERLVGPRPPLGSRSWRLVD